MIIEINHDHYIYINTSAKHRNPMRGSMGVCTNFYNMLEICLYSSNFYSWNFRLQREFCASAYMILWLHTYVSMSLCMTDASMTNYEYLWCLNSNFKIVHKNLTDLMTKTVCELDPWVKKLLYVCSCPYVFMLEHILFLSLYVSMLMPVCFYSRNIFDAHVCMFLCSCPYISMLEQILCPHPYVYVLLSIWAN